MAVKPKFDFSGYATKVGLKCSDGRVIVKDAFKHNDGQKVPLVWQHFHNEPANILGHAILENRDDGVYSYCKFNETVAGKNAKELVVHGDITALSIYANSLKQKGPEVIHGMIREVSLVLSGANPGAFIDNLSFAHGDEVRVDETEAVIFTGLNFNSDKVEHSEDESKKKPVEPEKKESSLKHAEHAEDATIKDVFDTLDETQKTAVYALIAQALESQPDIEHSTEEGEELMKNNVFDNTTKDKPGVKFTHADIESIMTAAKKGGSLKDAVIAHAATYGIDDIEVLFPDAKFVRNTPDIIAREDDWVSTFLNGINKSPFSRIKSSAANITEKQARARGYITGNKKTEGVISLLKRVTTPVTVYKKDKLDRDDITDITDLDVVVWLKGHMRRLLDEELARSILVSDGRGVAEEDKINEQNVRPIWTDDDLYAPKVLLNANTEILDFIDAIVRARKLYKGSGSPTLYTTEDIITDMMLARDLNQRRIYMTEAELASALRVSKIVAVDVMEDQERQADVNGTMTDVILKGIIVNPKDYTMGADKGGQVALFDDFDIDYNQYKYLIETRVSGTLTKPKSAVVIEQKKA